MSSEVVKTMTQHISWLEKELRTAEAKYEARTKRAQEWQEKALAAEAKLEKVRELHRRAHPVFSWARGGVRYEDPCPDCDGKAGVHPCGCWADIDIEYMCAECDGPKDRAPWPCKTIQALGEGEHE